MYLPRLCLPIILKQPLQSAGKNRHLRHFEILVSSQLRDLKTKDGIGAEDLGKREDDLWHLKLSFRSQFLANEPHFKDAFAGILHSRDIMVKSFGDLVCG